MRRKNIFIDTAEVKSYNTTYYSFAVKSYNTI